MKNVNEKKSTKGKQIRNAIAMIAVSGCMLSTATYAWFTMSNQPSVTGFMMTAETSGGLQVGASAGGEFKDTLALTTDTQKLLPVTLESKADFMKPVYTGKAVTSTAAIEEGDLTTKYVAKYTYYLHSTATTDQDVCLLAGPNTQTIGEAQTYGTFVKEKNQNTATQDASAAVRIGFTIDNGEMTVFEPNSEIDVVGKTAENQVTELQSDIQQTSAGIITKGALAGSATQDTSQKLCTITGGDTVEVIMYVWLEGTDNQCADEIRTDEIEAQVQFTTAQ